MDSVSDQRPDRLTTAPLTLRPGLNPDAIVAWASAHASEWVASAGQHKMSAAAGVVQRCPTLKPFTPNAEVSDSQASASVPATGATNCMVAERWPRKCVR
jgi:hypothetical protein